MYPYQILILLLPLSHDSGYLIFCFLFFHYCLGRIAWNEYELAQAFGIQTQYLLYRLSDRKPWIQQQTLAKVLKLLSIHFSLCTKNANGIRKTTKVRINICINTWKIRKYGYNFKNLRCQVHGHSWLILGPYFSSIASLRRFYSTHLPWDALLVRIVTSLYPHLVPRDE